MRLFGQGAGNIAKSLVKNGGIVWDNITKAEADRIAGQLRNLGAVVEVSKTTSGEPENGCRLKLISSGDRKIAVIKEVRKITDLGQKESKELIESYPGDSGFSFRGKYWFLHDKASEQ